jgi:acylphosphatase
VTRKYLIRGEVQGVGFRYFVLRRARALGLAGWARNLPDGRVEVVARGAVELLDQLEAALEAGPSHARVAAVDKSEISDDVADINGFEIR